MRKSEYIAESVPEFLSVVHEFGYPNIYRGQAKDWPLLPSIARPQAFWVEEPKVLEAQIIEKLKQLGHPFFHGATREESDWILHAQHYGLPTRFLDFTTNPLKALFFASERTDEVSDGIVFSLDQWGESTYPNENSSKLEFYVPTHINNRITAQESSFAVFPLVYGERSVKPLSEESYGVRLWPKIVIPARQKKSIRAELSVVGITRMSIFPGIEGVIEKIKEECGISPNG